MYHSLYGVCLYANEHVIWNLYSKTNQMHNISHLFYFGTTFYMFRTVSPSIIRSLRLYIQHQVYVIQVLWLLASGNEMELLQQFHHSTAVLCRDLEKNGMVRAWHGHEHCMARVNQTRPHCVDQMGKTHYKPLAARHGRGTACYV